MRSSSSLLFLLLLLGTSSAGLVFSRNGSLFAPSFEKDTEGMPMDNKGDNLNGDNEEHGTGNLNSQERNKVHENHEGHVAGDEHRPFVSNEHSSFVDRGTHIPNFPRYGNQAMNHLKHEGHVDGDESHNEHENKNRFGASSNPEFGAVANEHPEHPGHVDGDEHRPFVSKEHSSFVDRGTHIPNFPNENRGFQDSVNNDNGNMIKNGFGASSNPEFGAAVNEHPDHPGHVDGDEHRSFVSNEDSLFVDRGTHIPNFPRYGNQAMNHLKHEGHVDGDESHNEHENKNRFGASSNLEFGAIVNDHPDHPGHVDGDEHRPFVSNEHSSFVDRGTHIPNFPKRHIAKSPLDDDDLNLVQETFENQKINKTGQLRYSALPLVEKALIRDIVRVILKDEEYMLLLNHPSFPTVVKMVRSMISEPVQDVLQQQIWSKVLAVEAYYNKYYKPLTKPETRKEAMEFLTHLKDASDNHKLTVDDTVKLNEKMQTLAFLIQEKAFNEKIADLEATIGEERKKNPPTASVKSILGNDITPNENVVGHEPRSENQIQRAGGSEKILVGRSLQKPETAKQTVASPAKSTQTTPIPRPYVHQINPDYLPCEFEWQLSWKCTQNNASDTLPCKKKRDRYKQCKATFP